MNYIKLTALIVLFTGCEFVLGDNNTPSKEIFNEIQIESSFNYSTVRSVELAFPENHNEHIANVYQLVDSDTLFMGKYNLKSSDFAIDLEIAADGVLTVPISISGTGDYEFEFSGSDDVAAKSKAAINLNTLGSWNSLGVPDYLLEVSDVFDSELANDISFSLPEGRPVPEFSPEYLNGLDMNTIINDNADVWVTFVHEGAGYKNVLGYFSFDSNNPPNSINDVDSLTIVFPNVSFLYSGGGLKAGNKVYLGRFKAGTTLAWFLMPNAWESKNATIKEVMDIKYSINDFNNFTTKEFNQHSIILNDEERELLLLSFEDISRPGGDNDFNDAIFYVTANPYTAIETGNVVQTKKAQDLDGDGLFGFDDEFPNDPERAYTSFWPSSNTFATVLFEDQWPSVGDYDFNDLVADYKFTYVKAASGGVKELVIETELKAVGGLKKSSLLFNLGLDQLLVESVTGNILEYEFIKLNENGTEAGLDDAVIPIFDNSRSLLPPPTGYSVTNVYNEQPHVKSEKIITRVIFKEPVSEYLINKYDPFIITEFNRGIEIHLPGQQPTSKVNMELFGTIDDATNFKSGFTYKNSSGLPWALHVMQSIQYPTENADFASAYTNFRNWAESSGVTHTDWYFQNSSNMKSIHFYNKK